MKNLPRRFLLPPRCLVIVTMLALALVAPARVSAVWPPPEGLPMTRWAKEVSPDKPVLPEYPRPQLVREQWLNLNGMWDYAIIPKQADAPVKYDGKLLVPFPPQSFLSQVNKPVGDQSRIWYHRTFERPAEWGQKRVLINFGAVDWETHVWVNGIAVGAHTGGFDGFSCDLTDSLRPSGPQDLVVSAWNPVEGGQPHGKQSLHADGIFYTPTTGIWQTVWLEPVSASHIRGLRMIPDIDHDQLKCTFDIAYPDDDQTIEAVASAEGAQVARGTCKPGEALTLNIRHAKLWSPTTPFLYDLKIVLKQTRAGASQTLDSVGSYFGLRKISIGQDENGLARILLNNEPVFLNGMLDQGFWPEGVYTAPTDEALRYDLEMLRKMGYVADRKHIKVEPERWYYWADKLGVLVLQDMPACVEMSFPPDKRSIPDREGNFESEMRRMIDGRFNHPSIIMWILFNEGWGLPLKDRGPGEPVLASDVAKRREKRMTDAARQEDSTRLIDSESGAGGGGNDHGEDLWDFGYGDIIDYHCYAPSVPKAQKTRAALVGEYGWGLAPTGALENMLKRCQGTGISGCIVTQLTDVENEHNGALKYDRTMSPNAALEKDIPAGMRRVLHTYGYDDDRVGQEKK